MFVHVGIIFIIVSFKFLTYVVNFYVAMPKTKRFRNTSGSCPTSHDLPEFPLHAHSSPLPHMASDPLPPQHATSNPLPSHHVASHTSPSHHAASNLSPSEHEAINGESSQQPMMHRPPPRGHWRVIVIGKCFMNACHSICFI